MGVGELRGYILIAVVLCLAQAFGLETISSARADTEAAPAATAAPATGLRKLPWETDGAAAKPAKPVAPLESSTASLVGEPAVPKAAAKAPKAAAEAPKAAAKAPKAADEPQAMPLTPPDAGTMSPDAETAPSGAETVSQGEELAEPKPKVADGPPVPAHPTVAIIREKLADPAVTKDAHADDVAALQAFYRGWGKPPVWITEMGFSAKAQAALFEIDRAEAWGLDREAFTLPEPNGLPADEEARALAEIALDLAILKYARFARGGRHVPSEISNLFDQAPPLRDPETVIADIAAVEAPGDYLQSLHPQHAQFAGLREALAEARAADKPNETDIRRLVINMERWRWMPEDLGTLYVLLNTPEFMLYVMKDGEEIYRDKTLVGTIGYPTPIFSADLETIVFNPDWVAPPSVLRDKLWPALKRKNFKLLSSNKMTVSRNGKRVDPAKVNWSRVNIHNYVFRQAAGPKNVLGKAKFLYPNKHVVYMHDTLPPRKKVFKKDMRAIGYGCVRMERPKSFAALMLAEDHELPKSKVAEMWKKGVNKPVRMESKPPVHTTYFTAAVDGEGTVKTFKDLYGLDRKHAATLFGSTEGFPKPPPQPKPKSSRRNVASSAPTHSGSWANALGFGSD